MERYVVLRPVNFGKLNRQMKSGDVIEHDKNKRQMKINEEGPFPDDDFRAIHALEVRLGRPYVAIDNDANRKKAAQEKARLKALQQKYEDKSIYEAEKFTVVSEEGEIVSELDTSAENDLGKKYPGGAKKAAAKDPGKPMPTKIGSEGSFRADLAYKEGIETDFPIVEDNSSIAAIAATASGAVITNVKPPKVNIKESGRPKKAAKVQEGVEPPVVKTKGRPKKAATEDVLGPNTKIVGTIDDDAKL